MAEPYTEIEEHFCRTVTYICTRPGMYTADSSVNEVVHFIAGMRHGLFPAEKPNSPMILYKNAVLDPKGEHSNIHWAKVLHDAFGQDDDPEGWLVRFKDSFQDFCLQVSGGRFGIREIHL